MLEKAPGNGADVLIFDLEDAVRPDGKDEARGLVADVLGARQEGPPVYVRINGLETPWWEEDLRAVMPARPSGIVLPKPRGPDDLETVSAAIARGERSGAATGIIAIATETAEGTLSLAARSWRHPRLRGLMWGGEDLCAALGGTASRNQDGTYSDPIRLARSLCLMAARAAGVAPIDAVYVNHADSDGLRAEVLQARQDGFQAKAAIHPRQIDVIHAAFAPTGPEVRWAQEVVAALAHSRTGVAVVAGQMVDAPHLRRARAILSQPKFDS